MQAARRRISSRFRPIERMGRHGLFGKTGRDRYAIPHNQPETDQLMNAD